jgi:hypothetical protein
MPTNRYAELEASSPVRARLVDMLINSLASTPGSSYIQVVSEHLQGVNAELTSRNVAFQDQLHQCNPGELP